MVSKEDKLKVRREKMRDFSKRQAFERIAYDLFTNFECYGNTLKDSLIQIYNSAIDSGELWSKSDDDGILQAALLLLEQNHGVKVISNDPIRFERLES